MAFGNVIVLGFVFVFLRSASCLPRNAAPSFLEVGSCASISLMEGFEPEEYLGTWYTISNVPNSYIPVKKCMTDTVTMQDVDMKIVTKGFGEDDSPQRSEAVLSEVMPFSPFEDPFLQLRASLVPPVPYHIVETDYTSYSCVYSCFDLLNIRAELFFILSRTPEISPEARRRCLDLFEEKGVDTGKLQEMQQEGCPREGEGVGEEVVEAGEVVEEEVVEVGRSWKEVGG
ncbi:Crustacyanin-A2 subunit [Penaeus vannamei]|uniref:Crustacyanin-A2 subunit n=1 Tax=Penaeus vannamei TaxID=6689 RepID=A0A423SL75_PENVA|nr:Crustacyanin-A2 subunit [Penaeus vannamei]